MSEPRTRRQLREALRASRTKEWELDTALREATVKKGENTRLRAELAPALSNLDELGYYEYRAARVEDGELHREWRPAAGPSAVVFNRADIEEAQLSTRREALASVITALDIKGYTTGGYVGGARGGERIHDVDRFWVDIQTALEVREEKRVADERAATEKKVAGLVTGVQPLTFAFPSEPLRDLLGSGRIVVTDDGVGSSYGSSTLPKPTPKKKPTKKKSEDKK